MKTKRQIKNFILKTLLPYKEDSSKCGFENGECVYLTIEGNKCAVGRWMKKGEWQNLMGDYNTLVGLYPPEYFLLKPALDMGFTPEQWLVMQEYHDCLATEGSPTRIVKKLEDWFGVELPELLTN